MRRTKVASGSDLIAISFRSRCVFFDIDWLDRIAWTKLHFLHTEAGIAWSLRMRAKRSERSTFDFIFSFLLSACNRRGKMARAGEGLRDIRAS